MSTKELVEGWRAWMVRQPVPSEEDEEFTLIPSSQTP